MQIASLGDNLHAMSNPIFCEKKKATKKIYLKMSSANNFTQRVKQ